ncbi:MAG: hypothetical protein ACNYPI_04050 [Arenicellales bacterium WSBS_2016_MAG_OTU3]
MQQALKMVKPGEQVKPGQLVSFDEPKSVVGFELYYEMEERYRNQKNHCECDVAIYQY